MPGLRTMVVEDEGIIAMMLSDILKQLGHEVCAVEATESSAVAAADRFDLDLMIVDAQLREGRGEAAVETILLARHVPCVFVTCDPEKVRELSQDAVIVEKPFTEPELARAIARALGVEAPQPSPQEAFRP